MTINSKASYVIALTGTFDVKNYGDLLFPLIASWRLASHGISVESYSPAGCQTGWKDEAQIRPFSALPAQLNRLDGFLIGGGNIIHGRPANLPDYPGAMDKWAYLGLWAGATVLAAIANKPVLWNAPGVPAKFDEAMLAHLVHPALQASEYISVRDDYSRTTLKSPSDLNIHVVPDTAAQIAQLWPRQSLEQIFARMLHRRQAIFGSENRFAAIHVKRRSLIGLDPAKLAILIDTFSIQSGMIPILLAIGPCHGDDGMARDISKLMQVPHVMLDDPEGLKEIAATVAYSSFYIGCSLHGYITASSYDVPGRIVAVPALPKQSGFLSHVGRPDDLVADWERALVPPTGTRSTGPLIPETLLQALEIHWKRIAHEIFHPRPELDTGHVQFLRQFVRNGMHHADWDWAIPGFCTA